MQSLQGFLADAGLPVPQVPGVLARQARSRNIWGRVFIAAGESSIEVASLRLPSIPYSPFVSSHPQISLNGMLPANQN
jgi:hypothetical protein